MIALATADLSHIPVGDEDRPPLEEAFAGRAEFVRWDADVDWSGYELVVLRSTWDYSGRMPGFQRWMRHVGTVSRLLNPLPTVAWNLDKAYLGALEAGGVPVASTRYVTDLAQFDRALPTVTAAQIVVKPTVSAGSDHTGWFDRTDAAARELAAAILAQGRQVMLQPFYASVARQGEVAVLHVGGTFSHAVRKGPILDLGGGFLGGEYTETLEPVVPTTEQLVTAEAVLYRYRELAATEPALAGSEPLLYSRVDLIEGDDGESRCLELELVEPSFFFATAPGSAARFAAATLARL